MAGSQTLRFDIIGDSSSASRAFKDTASNAALAARGARQLSDSLTLTSKTARTSADATLALAKSDSILRDAQLTLAGATDDAAGSLGTLRRRLDELQGKTAAARVSLEGNKEAQARLDAIDARLIDLDHKTATPSLDIQGVARATAELSAVDVALDKVGGRTGSAEEAASSLGRLSGVAMPALIGSAVALSPVLVTTGFGLGGLAAAAARTVAPILQAGTATKQQQEALASLDPAQRAAYDSLGRLKTQFSGFAKSLEPETLGLFNKGLDLASGLLGDVQPVAAATGKALGGVLGQVDAEFRSQTWQKFFGFMADTAGPDVQLLGGLVVQLTDDLPPLLESLQPVATGFLGLATDALKAVSALEKVENIGKGTSDSANSVGLSVSGVESAAKRAGEQLLGSLFPGFRQVTDQAGKFAKSQGDAAAASAKTAEAAQKQAAAHQAAVTAATNLSTNLTTLEGRYGLTASQAEALVKAAGQSDKALQGSGSAAAGAVKAIEKYADASLNAKSPSQQLAGAISVLDNNTLGATVQLDAFTTAWNIIVGNSVSDQQAVLNTAQAFDSYNSTVKTSGQTSTAAQQAFLGIITTMGSGLSTLQKNGASVDQINRYYQDNINKLNALHGLTPQQRADVRGVTSDYNTWANSTQGLNGKLLTAAGTVKDQFTAGLKALGEYSPRVQGDIDKLANSVLKTGTTSSATKGDRAKLIADLHQAGIEGDSAAKLVNGLERQIAGLKSRTVNVGLTTSGSGQIVITGTGITARTINTSTGQVRAIGGHTAKGGYISVGTTPTADDVMVMASKGELVVPANMVKSGAVDHLRGKIPGFATGGVVGAVSSAEGQVAGAEAAFGQSAVTAFAQAALKAAQSAASAAAPAAGASGGIIAAMMKNMAAARGWTGAQWNALYAVEQREAGFNMTARNPTSGAYGLAQFINGPSEYAAYGGNATTAQGQITGMLNYIAQRYGTPSAAWAHEVAYGWYDKGGMLKPGFTLAYNGTGRPEQVLPAGRGGGPVTMEVHFHAPVGSQQELERWLLEANRKLARVKGGGNVQTAFGRQ